MIITQIRNIHAPTFTQSDLFINGSSRFCYVLEDRKQPFGIKVPGQTCIPEGTYKVSITESARWKKPMMLLSNRSDLSIEGDRIRFTGVRPHGGNDVDDTDGCPLCAFHTNNNGNVWGRASDALFERVKAAIDRDEKVWWVVTRFINNSIGN